MSHSQYQSEFIELIRPYLQPGTRYVDVFKNFRRGNMGLSLTKQAFDLANRHKLLFFKPFPYDPETFTVYRVTQFDKLQKSPYYISRNKVYISDPHILTMYEMLGGDVADLAKRMTTRPTGDSHGNK